MTRAHDKVTAVIKTAKIDQRKGDLKSAMNKYIGIFNEKLANHDIHEDYTLGIVAHQMGSIHAINQDVKWARASFAKAREMLKDDPFGLAITLRDEANFELLLKNFNAADKLIGEALTELKKPNAGDDVTGKRLRIEVLVTEGFIHRGTLLDDQSSAKNIREAVAALQELHTRLEAYGEEPQYTLANLQWITDYIEDEELRAGYAKRAIELAESLGNTQKRREFEMLLLGGLPLRNAYRYASSSIQSIQSFGASALKGLLNKVT